ncbi:MAG: prepilin-type N-terminal cleavage/methylation domain-containing protein [Candidatus Cloacimonetes bacterium]|nr:prepilin-type N-terminal cleavage/methylation domain-containing protein [Candidatus Cloacimonadota bacterium]
MKSIFFKNKGFTMLEVIVATMIMATGIIPIYHLMTSGTRGVEIGEREILAVGHTSSIIEYFKGLPFNLILKLCDENGSLSGKQQGFMVYDRNDSVMKKDSEISGEWILDASSDTGNVFFSQLLNPGMPTASKVYLPPLEKYFFERNITIDCSTQGAKYCIVASKIQWRTDGTKERSFSLKTVVTGQ